MSDIYITSDEHYGHRNIITYCNRPFLDTDHMREALINRFNEKVPANKNVLTIHLGDMFWNSVTESEAITIMSRLNGRHAFIYGNHDELIEKSPALREMFDWVKGENKNSAIHSVNFDNTKIVMSHYAMRVWDRSHKGSVMVFGHSHNELPVDGKSFDVGVDAHDFYPWSLDEIVAKARTLASNHIITPANAWAGKEVPPCPTCGTAYSCLDCLRVEREAGNKLLPKQGDYAGSTYHAENCNCSFCNLGMTRF